MKDVPGLWLKKKKDNYDKVRYNFPEKMKYVGLEKVVNIFRAPMKNRWAEHVRLHTLGQIITQMWEYPWEMIVMGEQSRAAGWSTTEKGFVVIFRQRTTRDNLLIFPQLSSCTLYRHLWTERVGVPPTSSIASTHLIVRIPHIFRLARKLVVSLNPPIYIGGSVASTTLATSVILLRLPVLFCPVAFRSVNSSLTSLSRSVFLGTDRELKREKHKGRKLIAARNCRRVNK